MRHLYLFIGLWAIQLSYSMAQEPIEIKYASHFEVNYHSDGVKTLMIKNPWPNSDEVYNYALIPKELFESKKIRSNYKDFECIEVPVKRIVLSSTTHIPSLVDLDEVESIVGFTGTQYISSKEVRTAVNNGMIQELGVNEKVNIESTIALQPDLFIGFSINGPTRAYEELKRFGIPIVYNADWIEQTPLAKAEWLKFFSLFFNKEKEAKALFEKIEEAYLAAKQLAKSAIKQPTVISGSLYKDVWYAPGKDSWAASFIKDANANYLFSDWGGIGSSSLSIEEAVLKGVDAQFWIAPSQYTSYQQMKEDNHHYKVFTAFKNQKIYTYALSTGEGNGLLYYELGPHRPDLILKDLIAIFHPELLKQYRPTFFKPLHP